jgi:hypothetical protein
MRMHHLGEGVAIARPSSRRGTPSCELAAEREVAAIDELAAKGGGYRHRAYHSEGRRRHASCKWEAATGAAAAHRAGSEEADGSVPVRSNMAIRFT